MKITINNTREESKPELKFLRIETRPLKPVLTKVDSLSSVKVDTNLKQEIPLQNLDQKIIKM